MADTLLNKYEIELLGENYTIMSDEPSELVNAVVQDFSARLEALHNASGIADAKRLALLTGLQLAQELHKLRDESDHISKQCNSLAQSVDAAISTPDH